MNTDKYFTETKKDLYNIIKKNWEELDTSDYDKNQEYYDLKKKKVTGKFHQKNTKKILDRRSKLYTYSFERKESEKINLIKCKRIKDSVVNKKNTLKNYKTRLFEDSIRDMSCISSYKHDLYSIKMNKLALSRKDEMWFVKDNRTEPLPWDYRDISKQIKLYFYISRAWHRNIQQSLA